MHLNCDAFGEIETAFALKDRAATFVVLRRLSEIGQVHLIDAVLCGVPCEVGSWQIDRYADSADRFFVEELIQEL